MPRLDQILVARGMTPSRSRALDWIRRGFVTVDGVVVTKAGHDTHAEGVIAVSANAPQFVSRGAEKLLAALDHFHFDPAGCRVVDVGASTGGFTEILLARGALHVTAVDVGRGQLHPSLQADQRVSVRESTDARALMAGDFPHGVQAITADVSFISLEKALPAVLGLAAPGAWLVALIKPQFEVGRAAVGKGGVVRDNAASAAAIDRIALWLTGCGWHVAGVIPSPITGGDGNQEHLIGARKAAFHPTLSP